MKKTFLAGLAIGTMMLGMTGAANATITTYDSLYGGSGDVQNVLYNDVGDINTGMMVTGHLNQSGEVVNFTGNETLTTPAIGQARIEAVDGAFTWIQIALADPTKGFEKIQFNIDFLNADPDGTVQLSFYDQFNTPFVSTWDVDANGENWFTAIATDNQVIMLAEIESIGAVISGISDLQQVRIGPADVPNNVPEPASMLLFGTGLIGLAGLRRRNKKN